MSSSLSKSLSSVRPWEEEYEVEHSLDMCTRAASRWGGAKREGSDWDGVQPLRGYLALGYVGGGQKPERA